MEESEFNRECLTNANGDEDNPMLKAADDTNIVTNMKTASECQDSDVSEVSDKDGLEVKYICMILFSKTHKIFWQKPRTYQGEFC